jgi:hypothetical protein
MFFYVRSLSNGLRKRWANDKTTTLVKTAISRVMEEPSMDTPKAVPDAGGCSVSETTIARIESPTASEYATAG